MANLHQLDSSHKEGQPTHGQPQYQEDGVDVGAIDGMGHEAFVFVVHAVDV